LDFISGLKSIGFSFFIPVNIFLGSSLFPASKKSKSISFLMSFLIEGLGNVELDVEL
jgi:hypothetical protein